MFTVKVNGRLLSRVAHRKNALGKVVVFDNSLDMSSYSSYELRRIYSQLKRAQLDEFLCARIVEETQKENLNKPDRTFSIMMAIFYSDLVRETFFKLVFHERMNIMNALNYAFDAYLSTQMSDAFYPRTEEDLETAEFLRKRLLLRYESILFQDRIKDVTQDSIIVVNEFKKEYFLDLPSYIQGLICKESDNYRLVETYSNEYQLPVAICDFLFEESQEIIIAGDKQEIIINPNSVVLNDYKKKIKEFANTMKKNTVLT